MITKTYKQGYAINCVSVGDQINKERHQASDLTVTAATYHFQIMNLQHLLGCKQNPKRSGTTQRKKTLEVSLQKE